MESGWGLGQKSRGFWTKSSKRDLLGGCQRMEVQWSKTCRQSHGREEGGQHQRCMLGHCQTFSAGFLLSLRPKLNFQQQIHPRCLDRHGSISHQHGCAMVRLRLTNLDRDSPKSKHSYHSMASSDQIVMKNEAETLRPRCLQASNPHFGACSPPVASLPGFT